MPVLSRSLYMKKKPDTAERRNAVSGCDESYEVYAWLSVAAGKGLFVRSDAGDCNLFPM